MTYPKLTKEDIDLMLRFYAVDSLEALADPLQALTDCAQAEDATPADCHSQCTGCADKQEFIDRAFAAHPNLDVDVSHVQWPACPKCGARVESIGNPCPAKCGTTPAIGKES